MPASYANITHGPIVEINGHFPSTATALLARAGAFNDMGCWKCYPQDWPKVESALQGLGVPMQQTGEPAVPTAPLSPVYANTRQKSVSMSISGDKIRIQGDLPKPVQKHWLGSDRPNGHVGMSPWAIEDFLKACKEQHIEAQIEPDVLRLQIITESRRDAVKAARATKDLPVVPLTTSELRHYQREAVAFGEACNGRFFIADMIGGGKTAEAIAWKRFVDCRHIIVVCPTITKGNWRDEIKKFDGSDALILDGFAGNGPRIDSYQKWIITGYDTLSSKGKNIGWLHYLKAWSPNLVIVDESHLAKGKDSDRSEAVRDLARNVKDVILMSGSPQSNSPMDLWAQLDALQPGWWGTWFEFGLAFCDGKQRHGRKGQGKFWDMTGVSNAPVLHERLQYVMIRRSREEIQSELPPQSRISYPMDLLPGLRLEYDSVFAEYREFVRKEHAKEEHEDDDKAEEQFNATRGKRMQYVMRLRQISSRGRVDGTVELVSSLIEQGKKPVVFAYFTEILHGLRDGLKEHGFKVGFIDGSVSRPQRDAIRLDFVAGKLDVLVGQTEAAGIGINLQEISDTTVTHELTYKPLDIEQTEGRVARSGQKNPTFHYYCLGEKTRDEKTLEIVLRKMAGNAAVLDKGVNVEDELLKEFEADFFH